MCLDLLQGLLHLAASLQEHPYLYFTIADFLIPMFRSLKNNMLQRGHVNIAIIVNIFSKSTRVIMDTLFLAFLIYDTYTNPWKVCCFKIVYGTGLFVLYYRYYFKLRKMLKPRSVMKNFPDATSEELATFADLCAICIAEMEEDTINKKLPCRHIFHEDCLLPWFRIRNTCPTCRGEFVAQG